MAQLEEMPLPAVYAVFMVAPDGKARLNLYNYLETWRYIRPKTNGHDLQKRGLKPGPHYQQILQNLRDAWLDEEVKTVNEELKLLENLTKE